ncbi:MAG: alpha/beta fold hydrolase [Paracoccaceae bacterium]
MVLAFRRGQWQAVTMMRGLALWLTLVMCPGFAGAQSYSAEVFAPAGAGPQSPVVIVLHGGGGSGPQVRRSSGFDELAVGAGVIALYPSGPWRHWNDGRRPDNARDDVAGILGALDDLLNSGLGDRSRVYVIGHSNGGGMAMRLACEAPERLAGIAVVATKTLFEAPCAHGEGPEIPALFIHATADPLAPHHGRLLTDPDPEIADLARRLGEARSAEDTLAFWSVRNGCAADPDTQTMDPDPTDDVSLQIHDFRDCDAPLRWIVIDGGGHAWPGRAPARLMRRLAGDEPVVRDIDAGAAALAFWFPLTVQ